jgi:hypothetical protein
VKVTQAILPVKVNYTPICKRNTDKNVCATTDPQREFKGFKILNPYYLDFADYLSFLSKGEWVSGEI